MPIGRYMYVEYRGMIREVLNLGSNVMWFGITLERQEMGRECQHNHVGHCVEAQLGC